MSARRLGTILPGEKDPVVQVVVRPPCGLDSTGGFVGALQVHISPCSARRNLMICVSTPGAFCTLILDSDGL